MKVICYTRSDGGTAVIHPTPEWLAEFDTEKAGMDALRLKDVPTGSTNIHECDQDDLPYRGSFRNAWEQSRESPPILNLSLARAIKTNQIRPERNERLAALDIDYMRADEAADAPAKAHIAARKQKLRDLPATIQPDLAELDTPEVLEAYQPAWPE
jgi:hypothetical protein